MVEQHNCPICQLAAHIEGTDDFGRFKKYNCPRCGPFTINQFAERRLEGRQISTKLSAWIRNRNEKIADVPEINSDNIEEIVSALPDYSPSEKQLILLRNIERKTKFPGYEVQLNSKFDAPLAWASEPEEFNYYLQSLIERGLLKAISMQHFAITSDGWDYLEKNASQVEDKTQVFVAMSFSEIMKPIWENAFKLAIIEAGYKAYRIDVDLHIERIDAKIIAEIKNSRFLVADVTEHKHGVYFEAGYALGLGLPVIWCVRKDYLEKVHFDTRQYNHIVWESAEQLKEHLYNFICAVVGKGRAT